MWKNKGTVPCFHKKLEQPFKKIIPQQARQYKLFWNGFSEFLFVFFFERGLGILALFCYTPERAL